MHLHIQSHRHLQQQSEYENQTLNTSSSFSDGLEVSSGHLSISGGNFTSTNASHQVEDSAVNIRSHGSLRAAVDNFTAVSGSESALKIMSEYSFRVTVGIRAMENFRLLSGGTGLAMESSKNGGPVSADITARNIEIASSEEVSMPRLAGIYLMSYYDTSKPLDLTMHAKENFLVSGQKYGLAGWGDVNVDLSGRDMSFIASRGTDMQGRGIYLDSYNKMLSPGRDVSIAAVNALRVDGYYGVRMAGDAVLGLSGKTVNIAGAYAAVSLSNQAHNTVAADSLSMQGEDYTALVYDSAHLDMRADTVQFNALGSAESYAAYISGENAGLSIQGKNGGHARVLANGYIKANKGGDVRLFMGDGSVYSGYTARENGGVLALNLNGLVRWNVVRDSSLSSLDFGNHSPANIDLRADGGQTGTTLTVDALSGEGGTFFVDTDIEGDVTDRIVIGRGTGTHGVYVTPTGAEPSREAMDSFLVQQQSGDGSFSLANEYRVNGHTQHVVEHGNYFYTLAQRDGSASPDAQEWYLRRTSIEPPAPDAPDAPVPPARPETPTGETEAALSSLAGHYALWYGQLTDLRKRLGEVRYGTQTGLWVRGFADKSRLDGFAGYGFTQHLTGGSLGCDGAVSTNEDHLWILGMQIRSGHADQRVQGRWGGFGDLSSVGAGLYSTWLHVDGWYLDAVAAMDWYRHEIRTAMLNGVKVNDDRSSVGVGASLEGGRRLDFAFSNNGLNSWFVEPQVQISWFWVRGGEFSSSNGMTIDQSDMNSLTGRAGVVLGKKFALKGVNGERCVQPYVKAGLNHEFLGEQKARINDLHLQSELEGTRVYYGLGADWQATDNLRLYVQAEREQGEHFTREYNISAGLKWRF